MRGSGLKSRAVLPRRLFGDADGPVLASSQLRQKLNQYPGYNITRKVDDWQQFIQESEFHLCPRGYGPTSYRLYECLQAETIPVYIWAKARTSDSMPIRETSI